MVIRDPRKNVVGFAELPFVVEGENMPAQLSKEIEKILEDAGVEFEYDHDDGKQVFTQFGISENGCLHVTTGDDESEDDFLFTGESAKEFTDELKDCLEKRMQSLKKLLG